MFCACVKLANPTAFYAVRVNEPLGMEEFVQLHSAIPLDQE